MSTEITKYYINKEGITDKSIWKKAFTCALSLLENNKIERIVLFFIRKDKIEIWFDKVKDKNIISSLWQGMQNPQNNNVIFCARTAQTYTKDNFYDDIIICMGCISSVLKDIDKYKTAKYIIAVPWQRCLIDEWIKENNVQIIE